VAQQATFIEELMAAGRGVFALLVGDRRAGTYFDLSQRGLVGSFIAFLIVVALATYLPIIMSKDHDGALASLAQFGIIYALQLGAVTVMLRQIKRMDAFVPYLVADNWMNFFVTLVIGAIFAAGVGGDGVTLIFAIIVIVIEVNIGRFVMTLAPLQIAMLIIAQVVGALIAIGIVLLIFPLPPEAAAQLTAS
jgi:hypothetical protein